MANANQFVSMEDEFFAAVQEPLQPIILEPTTQLQPEPSVLSLPDAPPAEPMYYPPSSPEPASSQRDAKLLRKHQDTSSVSLPSHNMRWTENEDELLRTGLLQYGYGKWKAISEHIQTRNPLQCKNRARHWLLTEKIDGNISNLPTISNRNQLQDELNDEEPTSALLAMMETSQPPSPEPATMQPDETPVEGNDCTHFDRDTITDEEKRQNPEWFCDSKSIAKSPERYMKIRNHILDCWHTVHKPEYMTKTAARRGLKDCGDVNAIGRVHAFLEQAGAINVGCPPAKPRSATRRPASSRRAYFYYLESDNEDDETAQKRKSRPDDDYDAYHGSSKSNNRNRPRPKRVTKKPQHYYDDDAHDPNDPFCLVPVEDYVDIEPPFHVDIASNALLVMDFHSHLSYTEIIGLLGGRYVHEDRKLYVECVFPCKGTSSTDIECEMDPESEMKAREMFAQKGLSVVGWYHSHPTFEPNPSIRDIQYQCLYQTLFRDETTGVEPFIGVIVNPSFAFEGDISRIQYVHIDHQQKGHNVPFACAHTIVANEGLSHEVVEQMTNLVQQFKNYEINGDFDTRMNKVLASLRANLPVVTEQVLDLLQNLRVLMNEANPPVAGDPTSAGRVSVM
ncbi:hypothetical protein BJV82DRAFT_6835 [Fennellomyces sp. T-0311]|nr:hypothetical protein BJV82DRAFT_6835 [Fennellomyces sp. T-0311]